MPNFMIEKGKYAKSICNNANPITYSILRGWELEWLQKKPPPTLATNPVFSTRDFKAPAKYRTLIPEYIKD